MLTILRVFSNFFDALRRQPVRCQSAPSLAARGLVQVLGRSLQIRFYRRSVVPGAVPLLVAVTRATLP